MRSGTRKFGWTGAKGLIAAALLLLSVAGCGADAEPVPLPGDEIFVTMSGALPLDFVMQSLPFGGITPTADVGENAIVHGYNVDRYLVDGAMIAIVWIHDPALGYPESGDLRTQVNPVVFRNDQMDGWGWDHLDLRAEEWNIVDRSQTTNPVGDTTSVVPEEAEVQGPNTQASAAEVESSGEESEDSETFSF